jgi:FAD/FMN-containing dehydrogenase
MAMAGSTPDWEALQRGIEGQVVLPGSPTYGRLPAPFNARFDPVRPQAVVRCATPEDVAETLAVARRYQLAVAPRSGGHSFAGHSVTHGVVLDVTPMDSVSVAGGVARVGAGTRLGDLYQALQTYDLTVPAGTCPTVGIAGLTLGGGLGLLGRRWGLTADHLLAAQIVLADGQVIDCDQQHHPELFWALRGAGAGQFGVVTSLAFRLRPAPTATNFRLLWPHHHAAAVVAAWQGWAPTAPDELAASLVVAAPAEADHPPVVVVFGVMLANPSDTTEQLDALIGRVGAAPATTFAKHLSWWETQQRWARLDHTASDPAGLAPAGRTSPPGYHVIRSEFFERSLPAEAITALVGNLVEGRVPGQARELDFSPWGGAYNRVPAHATAFVHRNPLYSLKHAVVVDPAASTAAKQAAHDWATRSWASVHPWGSGQVFPNFPDPDLENWAAAYYGSNYQRLLGIKVRYDPDNVFRFHQSLPVR